MHSGLNWISKSSKLTLKYFMTSSRFVPDSPTKILLNLLPKKKWFHLSRNLGTVASVKCYLRSIQIICISPKEQLLLSSIGLEVSSIQRIQVLDTAYWGFLGVGTTLDIFQNIHILYLEYGVLSISVYDVLSFIHLGSLVSAGTDTPYLP
ncbi:hypothetical protein Tco_0803462 [Tanacetum coccineum]|uniref:Uncharacterized protein n=1 Tax=Tanacetum coccineum TaxID=301880 RepID=A0ABQ5A1Q0_9ASTR